MATNKLKIIIFAVFTIMLGCIAFSIGSSIYDLVDKHNYPYMSGKYGVRCYAREEGNSNIKYHMYFSTLEDCKKYVEQNK
jgi:hypothetical protein